MAPQTRIRPTFATGLGLPATPATRIPTLTQHSSRAFAHHKHVAELKAAIGDRKPPLVRAEMCHRLSLSAELELVPRLATRGERRNVMEVPDHRTAGILVTCR